jgi:hypothetical protein
MILQVPDRFGLLNSHPGSVNKANIGFTKYRLSVYGVIRPFKKVLSLGY